MNLRAWAWDVAGLAFVGAAIWVGISHGIDPPFAVFTTLGATYLSMRATTVVQSIKSD